MSSKINELFFELIRVSLGLQEGLSRIPSPKGWQRLYNMADKQSLLGVCFAGVQRLCDMDAEYYCGMTEVQYLTWMGMAAEIQQRSREVDEQCVQLQGMLLADGMGSCVLKGRAVGALYSGELSELRQSGDVDVWVDAPVEVVRTWAKAHGGTSCDGDLHADCKVFPETDVELHFTPSVTSVPRVNRRLQEWFGAHTGECMTHRVCLREDGVGAGSSAAGTAMSGNGRLEVTAPTVEFNLVYLLHHAFRHYLFEGLGLRHVMDYYMVLQRTSADERERAREVICSLGMEGFAGAMMWVMGEVFHLDEALMICRSDSRRDGGTWRGGCRAGDCRRGERLLEVVMEGGNFGHGTKKYKIAGWNKPWRRLSRYVRRNWFMLRDYPREILWNMLKKL